MQAFPSAYRQRRFANESTPSRSMRFKSASKFTCPLQCQSCLGMTKTGARCRRRVCVGLRYCYQHLTHYGLRIAQSTIPGAGKGLFAWDRDAARRPMDRSTTRKQSARRAPILFKRGDFITIYDGELIDAATVTRRYGNRIAPYVLHNRRETVVEDGACHRGVGTLINDGRRSDGRSDRNAEFQLNTKGGYFQVHATRAIRHGEEILVNYGNGYWA